MAPVMVGVEVIGKPPALSLVGQTRLLT
jgi:hypothetical protein